MLINKPRSHLTFVKATNTEMGAAAFGLPAAIGARGGRDLLTQCPVVSEYLQRERKKGRTCRKHHEENFVNRSLMFLFPLF